MNDDTTKAAPIAPLAETAHGAEALSKLRDEIALPVACTELGCERRFKTPRALKMHGTLVHGWTPHPRHKYALKARASKVQAAPPAAKFKCKHCGVVFAAQWRLASHVRLEHPSAKRIAAQAASKREQATKLAAHATTTTPYNYCKNCGVKL